MRTSYIQRLQQKMRRELIPELLSDRFAKQSLGKTPGVQEAVVVSKWVNELVSTQLEVELSRVDREENDESDNIQLTLLLNEVVATIDEIILKEIEEVVGAVELPDP